MQDNGKGNEEWQEGFGMNAMKERAMNLQGQLSVYTKPEEGMLVTCTIPRQTEMRDGLIRLLIVDDQPFIRESLRTLLDRYEDLNVVGLAEDGEQAVDLCGRLQPHVVLMDLDMPAHGWSRGNQKDKAAMATYPRIDFYDVSGYGASVGLTAQRCGRLPTKINRNIGAGQYDPAYSQRRHTNRSGDVP